MNPAHTPWTPLLLSLAATAPLLLVQARRSTFEGFGFWTAGSAALCAAALASTLDALAAAAFPWESLIGSFLLLSYLVGPEIFISSLREPASTKGQPVGQG